MSRRALRVLLVVGLVGVIALAGAQLWRVDRDRSLAQAEAQTFETVARRLSRDVLAARASERAYVAAGQGFAFWKPSVDRALREIREDLSTLKPLVGSALEPKIDDVLTALTEVTRIEGRIAEHASAGRVPHAADLIFADGLQASLALERATDALIESHREAQQAAQSRTRWQELAMTGAVAGAGLLVALLLAPLPGGSAGNAAPAPEPEAAGAGSPQPRGTSTGTLNLAGASAGAGTGTGAANAGGSGSVGEDTASASAGSSGGGAASTRSGSGAKTGTGGRGSGGSATSGPGGRGGTGRTDARRPGTADRGDTSRPSISTPAPTPISAPPPALAPAIPPPGTPAPSSVLEGAAWLCSALARAGDGRELSSLLPEMAKQLGAVGLIVWLRDEEGHALKAALSHGYPEQTLAALAAIDPEADNATARAARSSQPQTVPASSSSPGALVMPMLTAAGCVGVVSIEIPAGREQDEQTMALARIFAAQLAMLTA